MVTAMTAVKLTTSEANALVLLAKHGKASAEKMSSELAVMTQHVSRVLASLTEKGLIRTEKAGLSKTVMLAETRHAMLLRKAILQFEHMDLADLLSGTTLEVLSAICFLKLKSRKEIQENSLVSEVSAAKVLENLSRVGIVERKPRAFYSISPRFETISQFVMEFRHYLNQKIASHFANDAVILWECNHEFIIETERSEEDGFFATGLSIFNKFGISLIVPKSYYFYSPFRRKLRLEDAILHSTLVPSTYRNMLVTLLVWKKNEKRIDKTYMDEQTRKYSVSDIMNDITAYFETKGVKRGEGFPTWNEFLVKVKEYGLPWQK
jgi:predicted transcriptional regulator